MVAFAIFYSCTPATAQQLGEISLPEAVAQALQNNNQVKIAEREIGAASARILQAGRIPNPEIEVSWDGAPSFLNLGEADEFDISFRQDFEFPTRRSSRIAVAEYDERMATLRLERLKRVITSRVGKDYFGLLLTESAIQSIKDQAGLVQEFFVLAQNRLSTGEGKYLDVIRMKIELTRLGNELVEAKRGRMEKVRGFNILLGREPDASLTLTGSLDRIPVPLNRDSLLESLPAGSSLLQAARASLNRQKSQLDFAQTSYLPDFSLSLSSQKRSGQPPFDANGYTGTSIWGVGLAFAVSVPLWFWQEPAGQVREAEALASIAEVESLSVRRRVLASVSAALDMVGAAEQQLAVFDGSLLADLEDIVSAAIDQYRNGQMDMLNVLDVYRTYRAARVEYNRALTNYWSSRADLDASAELPLTAANE